MKLINLIIFATLAVMSLASIGQSQELVGFDRSSFGSVVLSRAQAIGNEIELESAVGFYNNEPIRNYGSDSVFAKIGRSVGRLDVLTDKGNFPCTAFIISKKYILTNYHCSFGMLDNERIGASRIDGVQFVAGYTKTGIDEGTNRYTVIPTPIEFNAALDYAVLEVLGNPSEQYGELKLASLVPNDSAPFWIIGHPKGEGQRISREKCRASSPAVNKTKLLHTCDTLPGNSGSPVIDAGLQVVVALHHAGISNDDEKLNQAILMSKILENSTVLAAYKASEEAPKSRQSKPDTAAISDREALLSEAQKTLSKEKAISAKAQREVVLLTQQVTALRTQLQNLQGLLDDAMAKDIAEEVQIMNLGSQLNSALARVAAEERKRRRLEEAERKRLER